MLGDDGGTNIQVRNNKIFSVTLPITNNTIPVWNYITTLTCDNITVTGNQINWVTKYGPESQVWTNNTCTNTNFNSNIFMDTSIGASLFDTYKSPECN